ncbi:hypothetical protein ACIPMU_35645 [Streptomyces cyaneofuscatus]|uniref:hypothetical protein n=1 Tax=Streptomyces cyaneofuscatus TaxID=66883 RepID=UPI0037F71097
MTSYLIYTDDSGDRDSSFYTAMLVPVERWSKVLREWLKFRKWLYNKHQVPADSELHTYEWLQGKGISVEENEDQLIQNRTHDLIGGWTSTPFPTI